MDISTIKARLDNRFYRRASAVEFDVRYIFTNANKFNQPESGVVRSASVITELCLEIIRNRNSASATSVSKYGMLVEEADEAVTEPNTSGASAETTSNIRCRSRRNSHTESESEEDFSEPQSRNGVDISKSKVNFCKFYVIEIVIHTCWIIQEKDNIVAVGVSWKEECKDLLEILNQSKDAGPFREPVSILDVPDYLQVIEHPMDLQGLSEIIFLSLKSDLNCYNLSLFWLLFTGYSPHLVW